MGCIISRRAVRGYPLDDDCRTAVIVREADGKGDPRRYCCGAHDPETDQIETKCVICKAHINNVTPWNGERNGVLPGQISVEEYLQEKERDNK